MKLKNAWHNGVSLYRRRLFGAIWLMELCRCGCGAFFISGAFFLALRAAGTEDREMLMLSAAAIFISALIFSFFSALRKVPSEEKMLIYLSSLVPGGGVFLSACECGQDISSLPALPPLPRIRYFKRRSRISALLAGVCFAAGCFCLPLNVFPDPRHTGVLDLKDESEKISGALDLLQRSGAEGEKKALPLRKELDETLRKADPAAPGRSYELLHELNRRLRHELSAESKKNESTLRRMKVLQQSAMALSRSGRSLQHGKSFSQLLKSFAQKDPRLAAALKRGGFDGVPLDGKQLKQLADSLGREAENLKRNLQEMSRYLENTPRDSAGELRTAREELEQFIRENVPGCDDLIESLTNRDAREEGGAETGFPEQGEGTGSPARGRGDAVLEYSGYTPEYGARRVDRKMRSHLPGDRKDSVFMGRFAVDAEQKAEQYTVREGHLQTAPRYGGSRASNLYPAHRRAVRRYFERKTKP